MYSKSSNFSLKLAVSKEPASPLQSEALASNSKSRGVKSSVFSPTVANAATDSDLPTAAAAQERSVKTEAAIKSSGLSSPRQRLQLEWVQAERGCFESIEQLEKIESEISSSQHLLNTRTRDLKILQDRIEEETGAYANRQMSNQTLERQKSEAANQLKQLQNESASLQRVCMEEKEFLQQIESEEAQQTEELKSLSERVILFQTETGQEKEIEFRAQEKLAKMRLQLHELDRENIELLNGVYADEEELIQCKKAIQKVTEQIHEERHLTEEMRSQESRVKIKESILRSSLSDAISSKNEASAQIQRLRENAAHADQRRIHAQQERSALEERLHEMKLSNQKMRKRIAKLSMDKEGNIFSSLNAKNFIVDNLNKRNQELVSLYGQLSFLVFTSNATCRSGESLR
jgi:chromosome segregation ATPase